jgi:integrase
MGRRLTQAAIDAAQPHKRKDTYLWDARLIGFGVKITPAGGKTYLLQYRSPEDRRSRRLSVGRAADMSLETARGRAEEAMRLLRAGHDPADEKRKIKEAWTVKQLSAEWMEDLKRLGRAGSTLKEYQRLLDRHVLSIIGRRKARDLTSDDVERLLGRVSGSYQRNRVAAVISSMFTFARRRRQVKENPAQLVQRAPEKKRERYLSPAELGRLGDALVEAEEAGEYPIALAAIRLLTLTGARREEVLGLTWGEVDFENARLVLTRFKGKTSGDRDTKSIPLTAPALEVLQGAGAWRMAGNPHVFPSLRPGRVQGGGGHIIGLPRIWKRIAARAGLEGVRIHDLRHSFAAAAVSGGESLLITGKLLGHTQAATTARYAHLHEDPVRAAAEKTAAKIHAALGGRAGEVLPMRRRE